MMARVVKNTPLEFILLVMCAVFLGIAINTVQNPCTEQASAGLVGSNYVWVDSLVTTTVAQDSHFVKKWEQITIKSDTIDVWMRFGAPDTASWSSRDWYFLDAGETIEFGPATPLKRIEWKANSGTGFLTFVGYKKSSQY